MKNRISQREAHRLRRRVRELEEEKRRKNNAYISDWPTGVCISRFTADDNITARVMTARLLKHVLILVPEGNNTLAVFSD